MSKPTIVCVDDEKIVLVGLKEQLKRHFADSFSIETVDSGEEALEIIDELEEEGTDVPVVISDHIMPEMKGTELLVHIHKRNPRILTVLLTGQADADAVGHAVNEANLYRYICKPWSEKDLVLTLKEATRRYFQDQLLEEQNTELQRLTERLASEQATLVRLVAGIAHEVNTPLGVIASSSDTLARSIQKSIDALTQSGAGQALIDRLARTGTVLPLVTSAAERISTLVTGLKGFINLDESKERELDLRDTLRAVEAAVRPTLPAEVELHIECGDDPLLVSCTPVELSHIFLSLMQNAAEAIAERGTIRVVAKRRASWVEAEVIDDGKGMTPARLASVFDARISRRPGARMGLGLGLITSKRSLENYGGELHLESTEGEGTRALVRLPAR